MNDVAPNAVAALPWLVADIGGSNARFGWVDAVGDGGVPRVQHVRTLPVVAYGGPATAALAYLAALQDAHGRPHARAHGDARLDAPADARGAQFAAPRNAAFAVATAVDGDDVAFTNSAWSFSRADVQDALGLDSLHVVNDFEALALALPLLQPAQLRAAGPLAPAAVPRGMLAVVGPGTGLGVAGVVQTATGWQALPGEGGHATLAAGDALEAAVLAAVRADHGHVSAERLLSGIGLPVLHAALARVSGRAVETLSSEAIVERGTRNDNRASVSASASADDAGCRQTLDVFCALLGSFAGNVALTLGARGGVYIGGGIVPRLGELFFASRFRDRFEAKGRFRGYLQGVPTALITDTLAGLTGAAAVLQQQPRR